MKAEQSFGGRDVLSHEGARNNFQNRKNQQPEGGFSSCVRESLASGSAQDWTLARQPRPVLPPPHDAHFNFVDLWSICNWQCSAEFIQLKNLSDSHVSALSPSPSCWTVPRCQVHKGEAIPELLLPLVQLDQRVLLTLLCQNDAAYRCDARLPECNFSCFVDVFCQQPFPGDAEDASPNLSSNPLARPPTLLDTFTRAC